MAATSESNVLEGASEPALDEATNADAFENASLKRKASHDDEKDVDVSPKRARYETSHDTAPKSPRRPRSRSPSPGRHRQQERMATVAETDQERRIKAAQEERKRGKRLLGGLMSALSRAPPSTVTQQQKRRQEIERKQQERIQKEKAEDDEKRVEKRARLQGARMAEQIAFEEEVMKNQHSKRLAMARFLQTTSLPRVYFLPWKPTAEQQDTINEQIRRETETIASQVDQFEARKQEHIEKYGPPRARKSSGAPDPPGTTAAPSTADVSTVKPASPENGSHAPKKLNIEETVPAHDTHHGHHGHHDHHDESGDVLVEAEEDMVIY